MSAFALEDGVVYHTYSTYARGLDSLGACTSGSTARHAGATRPHLVPPPRRVRQRVIAMASNAMESPPRCAPFAFRVTEEATFLHEARLTALKIWLGRRRRETMTAHKTGTREEWLAARLELLGAEKELTAEQRRRGAAASGAALGSN